MIHSILSRSASLTVAVLLGTTAASQAAILSWSSEHAGSPLDFLYEPYGSSDATSDLTYSNIWDITLDGFNPAVHGIDGIRVWFAFADDKPGFDPALETAVENRGDVEERVDISLGGTQIWNDLEVDGEHPFSNYDFHAMTLDPVGHASIFADLVDDGMLEYTVELQQLLPDSGLEGKYGEDTYLKVAKVKAWFDDTPREVPEGGAGLVLFALTLAGLVGLRRAPQRK